MNILIPPLFIISTFNQKLKTLFAVGKANTWSVRLGFVEEKYRLNYILC